MQSLLLNAQINFQNSPIQSLLKKAKEQQKLLAFVIETDECNRCNDVAIKGLSSDSTKSILTKNFIITKVQKIPAEIIIDDNLYSISKTFFGLICTDENGNILSVHQGSTSNSDHYFNAFKKAIANKLDTKNQLVELKKFYYGADTKNVESFKLLIEKIVSLDLEPSQELIDELTMIAPQDSAKSLSFLQFVMKLAPLVNSNARNYLHKNGEYFNTAWYRLDLPIRQEINNKVTIKSLQKAVTNKDRGYAYSVANFKRSTYTDKDYTKTQKVFDGILLDYYRKVKDTVNYLLFAPKYFEANCMNVSVDSVLTADSIRNTKFFIKTKELKNIDTINKKIYSYKTTRYVSQASYYSNLLNEAAWTFYTFTTDIYQLRKALSWARRAVEFEKTFATADTYARLLYKTSNMEEAITWEKIAIDLAKKENESVDEFEGVLRKMEQKLSKIDKY